MFLLGSILKKLWIIKIIHYHSQTPYNMEHIIIYRLIFAMSLLKTMVQKDTKRIPWSVQVEGNDPADVST